MRRLSHRTMAACAAMVCTISAAAAAGNDSGAVPQQNGPVSQHVSAPPLNLTDPQRQQIQQAVAAQHAEVSFQLKTAKPAKSFQPTVHAKLPKQLKPHPFPQALFEKLPVLKHYDYVMFKNDVLVVNPINREIVDIISTGSG